MGYYVSCKLYNILSINGIQWKRHITQMAT